MSALATQMKADALEAQKFSRKHLVLELDFSPHSVRELERQCDAVEYAIRGGKSPDNIRLLTRIWGAYLGEALRTHLGGEWMEGAESTDPAPLLRVGDESLTPHEQVHQRLLAGSAFNLHEYYVAAVNRHAKP